MYIKIISHILCLYFNRLEKYSFSKKLQEIVIIIELFLYKYFLR